MPADTDWAYLAGIIDGEGCINVSMNTGGAFFLQLRITQKNRNDLTELQKRFGGSIYPKRRESSVQLDWLGRKADVILRKVFPYLRWKIDEAELAIAFVSQVMNGAGQKQDKVLGQFIKDELCALKKARYA